MILKIRHLLCLAVILLTCISIAGGTIKSEDPSLKVESLSEYRDLRSSHDPDYGSEYYWLSLPSVKKDVDVFYVYPTVSSNAEGSMNLTSAEERSLAQGIFSAQASLFEPHANVFAPYYRQMSTAVNTSPDQLATDTPEFKRGAEDVQQAFLYYIAHYNEGRPFILAGHSQGSMALIELIKTCFGEDETLRNRLVAAYLIGYTVTDEDLVQARLSSAESSDDVGVVITYNTQSVSSKGGPMLMPGAHGINPLNWRTDATNAPASDNLGARFYNDSTGEFIREVKNYCDAEIDMQTGALKTTIPDGEDLEIGPYSEGVYHRYDYAFWYRNLEQNVGERIDAFFRNS